MFNHTRIPTQFPVFSPPLPLLLTTVQCNSISVVDSTKPPTSQSKTSFARTYSWKHDSREARGNCDYTILYSIPAFGSMCTPMYDTRN